MFFTPHDLNILDKISYEKLFVCMFSYNSEIHPVSFERAWPFSQLHLKTIPFQNKIIFKVQNPLSLSLERTSSLTLVFSLQFALSNNTTHYSTHTVSTKGFYLRFSCPHFIFLPFTFSPLWYFFLLICTGDMCIFCIPLKPAAKFLSPAGWTSVQLTLNV